MHPAGHTPDNPHRKGDVNLPAANSFPVNEIEALKTQLLEARKQATLGELLERQPTNSTTRNYHSQLCTAWLETSRQRNP